MILLRSLGFNLVMYAAGAALSLWGQVLLRTAPQRLIGLGQLWGWITLAALRRLCGITIDVKGREHLPVGGGALIAAQHQSAFDTLVWLTLLPRPTYVLKHELLRLPLLGSLLVPAGLIAVDRAGGLMVMRKLLADCRAAIADGRQIVIFPEGTRVAPGERIVLQTGVAAIAKTLDLPIIPAATDSGRFWGRQAFRKRAGTLHIRLYPALPAGLPRQEMMDRLAEVFYQNSVDNSVGKDAGPL